MKFWNRKAQLGNLAGIVSVLVAVIVLVGFGIYFSTTLGNAIGGTANSTIQTLTTNTLGSGSTGFTTIFPLVVLAILIGLALSYVFGIIGRRE